MQTLPEPSRRSHWWWGRTVPPKSAARSLTAEVLGPPSGISGVPDSTLCLFELSGAARACSIKFGRRRRPQKSIEVPKLVEPRRISVANLVLVIGTMIGGWALIGVLIDVTNSFDTIIGADWIWVAAVFVLGNAAFVGTAVEDLGSVSGSLQFVRVLALEIGKASVASPAERAMIFATRVRFFQQQGYTPSVAVSSSAIVTGASWFVKGLLFVISLPLAWGTIHLGEADEGGNSNTVWLILVVVVSCWFSSAVCSPYPRCADWPGPSCARGSRRCGGTPGRWPPPPVKWFS